MNFKNSFAIWDNVLSPHYLDNKGFISSSSLSGIVIKRYKNTQKTQNNVNM